MTFRNRILALAGLWKLGDSFSSVLKMLPEARQAGVRADLETFRKMPSDRLAEKLGALRERERRRIARAARNRYGNGWSRLDPRVREWRVMNHGIGQDH